MFSTLASPRAATSPGQTIPETRRESGLDVGVLHFCSARGMRRGRRTGVADHFMKEKKKMGAALAIFFKSIAKTARR
jgi:hypothetical protein